MRYVLFFILSAIFLSANIQEKVILNPNKNSSFANKNENNSNKKSSFKVGTKDENTGLYTPYSSRVDGEVQIDDGLGITGFIQNLQINATKLGKAFVYYFTNYIFTISMALFVISLMFYVWSRKKYLEQKNEILKLKRENKKQLILTEELQIQVNHLKTRHVKFINSLSEPIKYLENKFLEAKNLDKSTQKSILKLSQTLGAYQELGDAIYIEESEFNLNALVSNVVKEELLKCEEDVRIMSDFDLAILKKVVGDKQKLAKVFKIVIDLVRQNTSAGRILVSLNQTTQSVDGRAVVDVVVRSGKSGFNQSIIELIEQAIYSSLESSVHTAKKAHDIKVAKRLLQAMGGGLEFVGKEGEECGFVLSFTLKIINRYALQESLFSKQYGLSLEIFLLDDGSDSSKEIQNSLRFISVDSHVFNAWDKMLVALKDTFAFVDLVIMQNSSVKNVDFDALLQKAKEKNFTILVMLGEDEVEDLVVLEYIGEESQKSFVRVFRKPYNKKEFIGLMWDIRDKQSPCDISLDS